MMRCTGPPIDQDQHFRGVPLLTAQALEILGLKPGATSSEIKDAYRDLVKVWHPDRFGNDSRLREKAEHQLKLINEAYRTLQSNHDVSGMYAAPSPNPPGAVPQSRRGGIMLYWRSVVWICGSVVLFVVLLAGYLAKHHAKSAIQMQDVAAGARLVPSTTSTSSSVDVRPRRTVHAKDPGPQQFTVRSLSEAETDRLQMTCSIQLRLKGEAAYQACLKVQVAMLMHPTSAPDLSALNDAERESIESACALARRRGPDPYNRCMTEQVASLAAEPVRPDLSTLSEADRHGIESACSNVKDRDGPAAYNRCLERFIEALAAAPK